MDIKIFDNLGTKTLIAYDKHSHHIDFVIMSEFGEAGGEVIYGDSLSYATESQIKNGKYDDFKEDNSHGFIKWDGCSNWNFGGDMMVHFCCMEHMQQLTNAVQECHEIAKGIFGDEYFD